MGAMLDTPWNGTTFTPPTALDIATIESAILAQLWSQITAIEVAHYPDQPETWRLTHRVGAALVQYTGATYGPRLSTAAIVQERRLEFTVSLLMRDLGWSVGSEAGGTSPGAYSMIEAVRAALTGYQVPGCRKAYPLREKFVERDRQGGVWIYSITFALSTIAIEAPLVENFPLFTRGLALEEELQTTINLVPASYTFSSSGTIQLPHGNVFALTATKQGVPLNFGVDYSLDSVNGVITLIPGGSLSAGDSIQIGFSYSDEVIATAGQTAPTN